MSPSLLGFSCFLGVRRVWDTYRRFHHSQYHLHLPRCDIRYHHLDTPLPPQHNATTSTGHHQPRAKGLLGGWMSRHRNRSILIRLVLQAPPIRIFCIPSASTALRYILPTHMTLTTTHLHFFQNHSHPRGRAVRLQPPPTPTHYFPGHITAPVTRHDLSSSPSRAHHICARKCGFHRLFFSTSGGSTLP